MLKIYVIMTTLATAVLSGCGSTSPVMTDTAISDYAPAPSSSEQRPSAIDKLKSPSLLIHLNRRLPTVKSLIPLTSEALTGSPPIISARRERYANIKTQPIYNTQEQPVSTFSIDIDTGAYSNIRRLLRQGHLPPSDAVRIEEMLNYFSYDYPIPIDRDTPFSISTEIAPNPWRPNTHLLQIGLRAYQPPLQQRPPANLVFLIDVSGSMNTAEKLGLVKQSLKLLTTQLGSQDRISLVVYAADAKVLLEPVPGDQQRRIMTAIDRLTASGSTDGAAGMHLAYRKAREQFINGGINRIILASDGDFNVGITDIDSLLDYVRTQREYGISLTTLGFGYGDYNDQLMEQLAVHANGNHAYIDTLGEASKVLDQALWTTLQLLANDVKIQVEFNPQHVAEYRLIGYENRSLSRHDFNNDKADAGDIGVGHTLTAVYEIRLSDTITQPIRQLRYTKLQVATPVANQNELAWIKLRYKHPDQSNSHLLQQAILRNSICAGFEDASDRLRFAAAVIGFGQLLRNTSFRYHYQFEDVLNLAASVRGNDPYGYRSEFVALVTLAKSLSRLGSHQPD